MNRWVLGASLSLSGLAAAGSVHAQANIALDRYEPSPAGSRLWSIADPSTPGRLVLQAGYVFSYSESPLKVKLHGQSSGEVVDHQLLAHGLLALNVLDCAKFEIDVPLIVNRSGTSPDFNGERLASPHGSSLADLRVGTYVNAFKQRGLLPAAALGFSGWLPNGDAAAYAGAGVVRWGIGVVLGADHHSVLWRASVTRMHQAENPLLAPARSGWAFAAGAAYRFGPLQVGPEVFGFTASDSSVGAFTKHGTNLEALLGLRFGRGPVVVGAAAGPGLTTGAGTPSLRALLSVSLTQAWLEQGPASASASPQQNPPLRRNRYEHTGHDRVGATSLDEHSIDRGTGAIPKASLACPGESGCPLDTDNDGIEDALDACPQSPGPRTNDPATNGCRLAVTVTGEQLVLVQQVRFATASDAILPESDDILSQLAQTIQAHPEIARIAVDGHTDSIGTEERNLALSRKRALAVVRWLVAHGVDERRLEARGFGPRQPLATNDTEQGRNQNRRVEFHIVKRTNLGERGWKDGAANE